MIILTFGHLLNVMCRSFLDEIKDAMHDLSISRA